MDPVTVVIFIFMLFLTMALFAFFVWFNIHRSKERERLLLLEKGVDFADLPGRSSFSFNWLKIGCLVTSATIGLILGTTLEGYFSDAAPIGMFLFGGIGLIIAHYVDKHHEKS
jgi:hypothetical protein